MLRLHEYKGLVFWLKSRGESILYRQKSSRVIHLISDLLQQLAKLCRLLVFLQHIDMLLDVVVGGEFH